MYQKNIDAMIKAWNDGDLDGLDDYIAPQAIRRAPVSLNSDAGNLGELKQVIADFRKAFPDTRVTIDEAYYQDDRSFVRWTFEGTNTGPGDFPATGKRVTVSGTSFSRYAQDKLTEELVNFDALDMMTQLGLVELPTADG
ncbi:MAG: ester cyclase [Longimicrobiales bacterium]